MIDTKEVLIQFSQEAALVNRLTQLGLVPRRNENNELVPWGHRFGAASIQTPLDLGDGNYVIRIALTDEEIAGLPRNDNPNFDVVWVEGDLDVEEVLIPEPTWQRPLEVDGEPVMIPDTYDPDTGEVLTTKQAMKTIRTGDIA